MRTTHNQSRTMTQTRFKLLHTALLCTVISCSGANKHVDPKDNDKILYQKAMKHYDNEEYEEALALFEKLPHEHPSSSYVADSELKSGDCHFERKKYAEAAEVFRTFTKLHPTHERLDYALFKAAEAYYFQAPEEIDRDLTNVRNSIKYFDKLLDCCPQSKHRAAGQARKDEGYEKLARRSAYIGDFYYKRDHFAAALRRYREALETYPQYPEAELLGEKIAACLLKTGDRSGLETHLQAFGARYPGNPRVLELKEAAQQLPAALPVVPTREQDSTNVRE